MSDLALLCIFTVLMAPGLLGIVLPIIPGIPYMFIMALTYALVTGFRTLHVTPLMVLGGLTALSILIDYYSGLYGARIGGASRESIRAGLGGMLLGTVILPPFGGIALMVLAVLASEAIQNHGRNRAVRAAAGTILGVMGGSCINGAIGILFIVLFVTFAI